MKSVGLVLVAGGSGKRMGSSLPKQFISLHNKPILQHTIDLFLSWNKNMKIVLVLPEDQIDFWKRTVSKESLNAYTICKGGEERFFSVKNGLEALGSVDYVMIHDGVRPCVNVNTLNNCMEALDDYTGVIPVISPSESVRIVENENSRALDRDKIRLVQTPQCFHYPTILKAYHLGFKKVFTDDASVFEEDGNIVHLIKGNSGNIKITRPEDLEWANIYLQQKP